MAYRICVGRRDCRNFVNAMEPPVSPNCGVIIGTDENLCDEGTSGVTITSFLYDHVTSQQPGVKFV